MRYLVRPSNAHHAISLLRAIKKLDCLIWSPSDKLAQSALWALNTRESLITEFLIMPSFSLQTLLAALAIMFLTATPSLSGGLCNKSTTASSEEVVVANLEEDVKEAETMAPPTPDHTASE